MTKKPLIHEIGVQLSDQTNARTYNERDEGLLYNKNNEEIRVQIEGSDREVITNDQTQTLSNKTLSSPTLNSPSINVPVVSGGTFDNIEVNSASINSPIVSDGILTNSILNNVSLNSPSLNSASASGGVFDNITTNSAVMNSPEVYNGTFDSPMLNSPSINSPSITGGGLSNIVLTNSTIDVDNNTVSNIELDNLKSGVLLTTTVSVSINDTSIFSAKAIKDYVDQQDSSVSGNISAHIADTFDAHMATSIGVSPYLNLSSTDVQSALQELQVDVDTRLLASEKGAISGVCPLGADQKVSATYLPSYVDDILEYANLAAFPVTGESGKIYVALDTNLTYRWSGSAYVEISQSLALGETSTTAYRGDRGATAYSHSQATSGIHGLTGSPAGTSDTQVLTNKDFDGGTASDSLRVTLPKNTLSNLQGLTRKEGTIVYATDTDKVYYDDGTNLNPVGAGGVGNVSTYALLKSDDDTGTWATGNNATFLGGGSIQGTFTKQSTSSPLNGTYSYLYTQAAGSLNDYFCSDTNVVPLRSRNSATSATNLCRLKYTYNGSANDIKLVVYDATNSTILASTLIRANADYNTKFEILFEMPYTCTSIKFGGHVLVANNGKVLKFDDIEFSDDPFQSVNTVEEETWYISQAQNAMTDVSGGVRFNLGGTISVTKNGVTTPSSTFTGNTSGLLYCVDNSGSGETRFYCGKSPIRLTISASGFSDSANATYLRFNKNGSTFFDGTQVPSGSSVRVASSSEIQLTPGDYVTVSGINPLSSSNVNSFIITFVATSTTSNVIQSWADGSDWTSYTPVYSNMGTVTTTYAKWKRDGSDILVDIKFTKGVGTSSVASVSLPNGVISANTSTQSYASLAGNTVSDLNKYFVTVNPNSHIITFGILSSSRNPFVNLNGNDFTDSVQYGFFARIPIQGWSSSPTLLALPTSKENVYRVSINPNTNAITSDPNSIVSSTSQSGGLVTVNLKPGIFIANPITVSNYKWVGANDIYSRVETSTTSSITIALLNAGDYRAPSDNTILDLIIAKSSDYTPPGVFVGNVAKNQVAIVQYRGNGTRTTLSTTPVAMPLTTVKGDTSIVSIASNQFTLQAGEYEINTWSFYFVSGGSTISKYSYIYSISDAQEVDRDPSAYTSTNTAYGSSSGVYRISLTTAKTFEYRHLISSTGTCYLGDNLAAPNDLNGFIKITKLNGQ